MDDAVLFLLCLVMRIPKNTRRRSNDGSGDARLFGFITFGHDARLEITNFDSEPPLTAA